LVTPWRPFYRARIMPQDGDEQDEICGEADRTWVVGLVLWMLGISVALVFARVVELVGAQ
jgi:hypothetical protein